MRCVDLEEFEIARINLLYAKSEIMIYGDKSDYINRVLHHIIQAENCLTFVIEKSSEFNNVK
jgi:hypothetical protein